MILLVRANEASTEVGKKIEIAENGKMLGDTSHYLHHDNLLC